MMMARGCARFALALLASAGLTAQGAAVSTTDLTRCAAIATPDARLACYDALAHRVTATPAAPSTTSTAPTPTVSAPPSAPTPAPAVVEDPKNFGLSAAQQHVERPQIQSEEAQIVSIARVEPSQALVVLDNGQSWRLSGDDGWLSKGEKVTIKRASMGSFLMHTASKRTYSVRRIN